MIFPLLLLLAADGPYFAGKTDKPPADVARCTAAVWKVEAKRFKVRTEVDGEAYAVVVFGSSFFGGKDMVARIEPDGAVTMTRRPALWGKLDDRLRDALAACI